MGWFFNTFYATLEYGTASVVMTLLPLVFLLIVFGFLNWWFSR